MTCNTFHGLYIERGAIGDPVSFFGSTSEAQQCKRGMIHAEDQQLVPANFQSPSTSYFERFN